MHSSVSAPKEGIKALEVAMPGEARVEAEKGAAENVRGDA